MRFLSTRARAVTAVTAVEAEAPPAAHDGGVGATSPPGIAHAHPYFEGEGIGVVGLSEALRAGLAADGGLFVPARMPTLPAPSDASAALEIEAARFLAPFFQGDPLEHHLEAVCREAFDFPFPLVSMAPKGAASKGHVGAPVNSRLELFHGPTAAFKDFGACFLAACLSRIPPALEEDARVPRTVLVATSGDTGGAVAAAFAAQPNARVWILFPDGRVSPRQEAQLTCWGERVSAFAVRGSFDDCQAIVKQAFLEPSLRQRYRLTSANSINLGRLLPQAAYCWTAALEHRARTGRPLRPIIPTGNLGHALAAVWAREVGAPIGEIVLALNANRAMLDLLETGEAAPRPAIPTLANAMDVGVPSNLERLRHLHPHLDDLRRAVQAFGFDDDAIRDAIRQAPARFGFVPCPHTACALLALDALEGVDGPRTVFATAHPAKFDTIVEPLVGHAVPPPPALAALLERPKHKRVIGATLQALLAAVESD